MSPNLQIDSQGRLVHLLTTEGQYDVAVLLTGDGDFERPVEVLRARGKRVVVASIPEMTSYELRNAADTYVDLGSLRDQVERPGYRLPSEQRDRAHHVTLDFSANPARNSADDTTLPLTRISPSAGCSRSAMMQRRRSS